VLQLEPDERVRRAAQALWAKHPGNSRLIQWQPDAGTHGQGSSWREHGGEHALDMSRARIHLVGSG
jgi:hypothetical protein